MKRPRAFACTTFVGGLGVPDAGDDVMLPCGKDWGESPFATIRAMNEHTHVH